MRFQSFEDESDCEIAADDLAEIKREIGDQMRV